MARVPAGGLLYLLWTLLSMCALIFFLAVGISGKTLSNLFNFHFFFFFFFFFFFSDFPVVQLNSCWPLQAVC